MWHYRELLEMINFKHPQTVIPWLELRQQEKTQMRSFLEKGSLHNLDQGCVWQYQPSS